jgi:predicted transcriptional regulator
MSRDAAILEALTKTPAGLTVVELSLILNRTGGDITKGVSSLKKAHNIVTKHCMQEFSRRKTVKYILNPVV